MNIVALSHHLCPEYLRVRRISKFFMYYLYVSLTEVKGQGSRYLEQASRDGDPMVTVPSPRTDRNIGWHQ
jgi:hypothetical protein